MGIRRDAAKQTRDSERSAAEIHCPTCDDFRPTYLLRIPRSLDDGERNFYFEDHPDISWLRRKRRCAACGEEFLTAEVAENLLNELVMLRQQVGGKRPSKPDAQHLNWRVQFSWLDSVGDDVPYDLARRLVEDSAWWLTHGSGNPVRAPGHAKRLQELSCGWCVEFGANWFAASRTLGLARDYARAIFELGAQERLPSSEEMRQRMRDIPPRCVLSVNREFYDNYPVNVSGELVFGAQAIDVNDCARVLMEVTGLDSLLTSIGME